MIVSLLAAALAQSPPDIQGAYRLELSIANQADMPFFGEARITSNATILATIRPDGSGGYVQDHVTCALNPESSIKLVKTKIPQSFIDPMPAKTYPLTLRPEDDGGWAYAADTKPQYIGYDPARASSLPKEADHPAIADWEGDGAPGATIHLQVPVFGQVEVYIVQFAHTRLAGRVNADGTISGQAEVVAFEQHSIGGKPEAFAANPNVTQVPGESVFTLTPLPDGATCADVGP